MERPQVEAQPIQRAVTGEIVYLDEMRRQNEVAKPFLELGDMAIQAYESEADLYAAQGVRPDIMDEYEQYDHKPAPVVASCIALTNELLKLKEVGSRLTFVDIAVDVNPEAVLKRLKATAAGSILAPNDEQLAIESDGTYYPILDIRKQTAQLTGVGVRAWGWDSEKYVFTNQEGEQYSYPEHALVYPSDEKSSSRQLEISFGYQDETAGTFTESVSLHLTAAGSASISSNVWAMAYAETGYEGHIGSSLDCATDDDIAAFGDLLAEIVGDEPESVSMRTEKRLAKLAEGAATPDAKQVIQDLVEATWPAQANYILNRAQEGVDKTIAQQLHDIATADTATAIVRAFIEEWNAKRRGE